MGFENSDKNINIMLSSKMSLKLKNMISGVLAFSTRVLFRLSPN